MSDSNAEPLKGFSELTIADQITGHLLTCMRCAEASRTGPVGLGQKSAHCDAYWQLVLAQAEEEGFINNIVAHDEHGNEADNPGKLDPNRGMM